MISALELRTRSPIVDGLFYPEDEAGVLSCMQKIALKPGKGGIAKALIAPHGAWEISGILAGAAFAAAAGRTARYYPERVVVLGPIHEHYEEGIFLTNSHSFQTPLGEIPVDQEGCEWLASYSPLIRVNDIPHLKEHSIEVLLPFVKYCFPDSAIVPILMRGERKQHIRVLANALRAAFMPEMENTLLIVSCNIAAHSGKTGAAKARNCMRLLGEGNHEMLCNALNEGQINGCGWPLILSLLQSGLVDGDYLYPASDILLSARGDDKKTVYYGAFAFE